MNNKNIYLFVILFTLLCICITGCSSTAAVPYSFAEDEKENGTAKITFIGKTKMGVDLFYFENVELPVPKKKSYWSPVIVPAGRPFELTVNVYSDYLEAVGKLIKFKCPALTAGDNYDLSVKITKEKKFLFWTIREGSEKLILKDKKTKKIIYEQ